MSYANRQSFTGEDSHNFSKAPKTGELEGRKRKQVTSKELYFREALYTLDHLGITSSRLELAASSASSLECTVPNDIFHPSIDYSCTNQLGKPITALCGIHLELFNCTAQVQLEAGYANSAVKIHRLSKLRFQTFFENRLRTRGVLPRDPN